MCILTRPIFSFLVIGSTYSFNVYLFDFSNLKTLLSTGLLFLESNIGFLDFKQSRPMLSVTVDLRIRRVKYLAKREMLQKLLTTCFKTIN